MIILFLSTGLMVNRVSAQAAAQPAPDVEETTEQQFTDLLKQVWSVLKVEMEKYQAAISNRSEFETSGEFGRRATDAKRQMLEKFVRYSREHKLHERVFSVPFKAVLKSYNPESQVYSVLSGTTIQAPYNIPVVESVVPNNPYLALADSVTKGYRTSNLYLRFRPDFKWRVERGNAQVAKAEEAEVFFRVHVKIDIESPDIKDVARLKIVPKRIVLVNQKDSQTYWQQAIL
ncbi:MAG: hypothetical protein WD295_00620 [Bacteroidota bacterium]